MKQYFKIVLILLLSNFGHQGSSYASKSALIANEESKINSDVYSVYISLENSAEEHLAYGSAWAWDEDVFTMLESHVPFIFRTKRSAQLEEVKVLLYINNKGKVVNFEMLTEEADKGLVERLAHVLRKLPHAQPVPGYHNYEARSFELVFSK